MTYQENQPTFEDTTAYLQEYAIGLETHEPKYYERIPDILDYLTYIKVTTNEKTGEKIYERKRLSPIEKELYRIIKKAAGDTVCFKNTENLSWELNCSKGAIVNAKKVLCEAFEQLNGESLIEIEERLTSSRDGEKIKNKKIQHFITVKHIWNHNNAFMASYRKFPVFRENYHNLWKTGVLKEEEGIIAIESLNQLSIVHKSQASSPDELAFEARSSHELAPQRASSSGEPNHTNHNHTPYDYSYPRSDDRNMPLIKSKIYELMNKLGIYPGLQKKLITTYGWDVLERKYNLFSTIDLSAVGNKGGYFAKMLED